MGLIFMRLYRVLPLMVVIAILTVALYVITSTKYDTLRAKQITIKVTRRAFQAGSAAFGLATLYAWFDGNVFVTEFMATCLGLFLVCWGIVEICAWNVRRHNPPLQFESFVKVETEDGENAETPSE